MSSKPITPTLREALNRWYVAEGLTQEQIARIAGVNRSSVNAWLAGDARSIRGANWARLLPYLREYLPPEEIVESDIAVLPECGRLIEDFRCRVQDAVMASDLDDAVKVKVWGIVRSIPAPGSPEKK